MFIVYHKAGGTSTQISTYFITRQKAHGAVSIVSLFINGTEVRGIGRADSLFCVITFDLIGGRLIKRSLTDEDLLDVLICGELCACGGHVVAQGSGNVLDLQLRDLFRIAIDLGAESAFRTLFVKHRRNDDLGDIRDALNIILDLLGVNVLAVGEDDEVLLTSRDDELTALVDGTVVAGVEFSVDEDLCGLLGVLVVAEHDRITLDCDLAQTVLVHILNGDIDAGKRNACRFKIIEIVAVCGYERRAFGDAVAVYQCDSDAVEELTDLGADGCAAADDLA